MKDNQENKEAKVVKQCTKGHEAQCQNAKSQKCTCDCDGDNHGKNAEKLIAGL